MANILTSDGLDKISKSGYGLVVYGEGEVILAEGISECSKVHTNMLGCVLCLKGNIYATDNERTVTINENDMFVYHPNMFLELKCDKSNVEMFGIFITWEYMKNLAFAPSNMWDVLCFFEKSSVVSLDSRDVSTLSQYYEFIKARILEHSLYGREIISALMQAFIYQLRGIIGDSVRLSAPEFTSSERLFKEFTRIIMSLYPKPRSVCYYADKLNVTPKYLSAVCKEISGKTASDIITSFVVKDIKFLLTRTEKGIKEITHELDFSSISFFGKYVKKNLGMSPKNYRKKFYESA